MPALGRAFVGKDQTAGDGWRYFHSSKRFINPRKGMSLGLDGQIVEIAVGCLKGFITGTIQALLSPVE